MSKQILTVIAVKNYSDHVSNGVKKLDFLLYRYKDNHFQFKTSKCILEALFELSNKI